MALEDLPFDAQLIEKELRKAGFDFTFQRVDKRKAFLKALQERPPDLILSDYNVPQMNAIEAIRELKAQKLDIPFILITGSQSEEVAVACMKEGMDDYLLKQSLKRLPSAVQNAIEKKSVRQEKRKAIAQIQKANEELKRMNELKTVFLAMVSHELKTPLSSIKAGIDLLAAGVDGPMNASQNETLNIVQSNIDRLSRLVNNVLDYTHLEAGQMKLQFELTDLCELVRQVKSLMILAMKGREIDFSVDLPSQAVKVICDPDKMKQVLVNLLDNSIKFTEKAGKIRLSLDRKEEQKEHQKEQKTINLIVEDNGVGIPVGEQEKIFEIFHQSPYQGAWKCGGSGVGLAICKQIIELHHGRIWVENAKPQGSRFHISLPINPPKPS